MAYNPGITYTGGESIARGIEQAASSLMGGIMERSQKRQEKEKLAAATKALQPMIEKLAPGSGVDLTKDVPKEAIPQFIQLAGEISRRQQETPLREVQLENEKLRQRLSQSEIDRAAANAAALPEAATGFTSGDPSRAMASYLQKGGNDPRVLAELGDLAAAQARGAGRGMPGLQKFGMDASGRPVEGLVDAQGNVKYIEPPKTEDPVAKPFKIGNRQLYRVGSDILDDQGQPVRPETTKPLDPMAAQIIYSRYQTVLAEASQEPKSGLFTNKEKAAQRTKDLRKQANFLAGQLDPNAPKPFPEVEGAAAPTAASPAKSPAKSDAEKPYVLDGDKIQFTPGGELLTKVQAAFNDGVLSEEAARKLLESNGYKRKSS